MIVLAVLMTVAISIVLYLGDANSRPVGSPPVGSPGTASAPRPVSVIMRDYHFDPTPLYLYPGETIRLTVLNAGMIEHELVLGASEIQAAWERADAAATPAAPFATAPPASVPPGTGGLRVLLPSGGTTTVTYEAPAEPILLQCNLPGHLERGMSGLITLISR